MSDVPHGTRGTGLYAGLILMVAVPLLLYLLA